MADDDQEAGMNRAKMSTTDPATYGDAEEADKARNTRRNFGRKHKTPSGRSGKGRVKHRKPVHAFRHRGRV
jgi:hypothetical protein